MSITKFIHKISEEKISGKIKYFYGYSDLMERYIRIGNIAFSENKNKEILDLLDISGKILMFGEPGIGKTSLAYYIANVFLDKDGIESYKLSISDLIQSDMGATTKNMAKAINEIKMISEDNKIILILDEIDRISVRRSNCDEISELKRTLIEFMDFLDEVNYTDRMLIIGITNSLDLLDKALIRRFDFVDEIKSCREDLLKLLEVLLEKLEMTDSFNDEKRDYFIKKYNTGDKIKKYFKKLYLDAEGRTALIKEKLMKETKGGKDI